MTAIRPRRGLALATALVAAALFLPMTSQAAETAETAAATGKGPGTLVVEAYTQAARAGVKEARPTRPRTVNARGRDVEHGAPPPPAGVGRRIPVKAYAYHLRGFTARGTRTRLGAIAVDPRVIPLGSKLYIPGYGWGRAVDTGGAIQGRKIDVWLPTMSQCMQWGIRDVTVIVVP